MSANRWLADYFLEQATKAGYSIFSRKSHGGFDLYQDAMIECIRSTKYVVAFIDEAWIASEYNISELMYAIEYDRVIFPIVDKNIKDIPLFLKKYQLLICDFSDKEKLKKICKAIIGYIMKKTRKSLLYERLGEHIKIGNFEKIADTVIELSNYLFENLDKYTEEKESYLELIRFLKIINKYDDLGWDNESKEIARKIMPFLLRIRDYVYALYKKIKKDDLKSILEISIALTLLVLFTENRTSMIDTLSNGDYHVYLDDKDLPMYQDLVDLYNKTPKMLELLTEQEQEIVNGVPNNTSYRGIKAKEEKENPQAALPELIKIAEYIKESNKLFEELKDSTITYEFMTCLKTSYERLKNYCIVVGYKSIASECVEKITEINEILEKLEVKESSDDEVEESSFKALLGFNNHHNDAYDVFISYKHEDIDLASNVYKFVKGNLVDAFFDVVSLPQLGESEYHDAIMDALDKTKHFVVVLSKFEYLDAYWVDLEMKTYKQEKDEGRKPGGNLILIVTPEMFKTITETNKKCLNIKYRSCQILQTTDYKESLLSYLKKDN